MRVKLIAFAAMLLLMGTPVASAHTALVSSSPANNANLHKFPKSISLTFNENLIKISDKNVSKISIAKPDGTSLKVNALKLNKSVISVDVLDTNTPKGIYKVTYRVVSGDGHPVSGTITFKLAH